MIVTEEELEKIREKDEYIRLELDEYEQEKGLTPLRTSDQIIEFYGEEFLQFIDRSSETNSPNDLSRRFRYRRLRFYETHVAFRLRHPISSEGEEVRVLRINQPQLETSGKISIIQQQQKGGSLSNVEAMYAILEILTKIDKSSLRRIYQVDAKVLEAILGAFFGSSPDESSSGR